MACKIFTNEIPLGHINDFADFIELVVRQDVRPERPDDEDAPQLSDGVWEFAERCWVKNPQYRLTAAAVCDILSHLLVAAGASIEKTEEDQLAKLGRNTLE